MSTSDQVYCYTYFDCKETDCIRREELSKNCWDIDDVRCQMHSPSFKELRKQFDRKLEACKLCIYYKSCH